MKSEDERELAKRTWLFVLILVIATVGLYHQTIPYGYVGLDDTIFISELESYNKSDSAFAHSFKRGVFGDTSDTYYRPLLLSSFAFDRFREGKRGQLLHSPDIASESLSTYRWTNILLHVFSVLLFFALLKTLRFNVQYAFLGSLIIAVHPALVQAVAWIPGRNDTLLGVFVLAFFLSALWYFDTGKWIWLPIQMLFYLCAIFTKETGLMASVVLLALLVGTRVKRWSDKSLLLLMTSWAAVAVSWLLARSNATVQNQDLGAESLLSNMVDRLPVVLQYLGKILLPVNLAVVPYQDQTTITYGVVALLTLITLVVLDRNRNVKRFAVAGVWFLVFLLPVLIVPRSLNQETYEHRMYLPMMGIVLMVLSSDTVERFRQQYVMVAGVAIAALLFSMSYTRMDVFRDRVVFWQSAAKTSPKSAFCLMNLGSTYMQDGNVSRQNEGEILIRQAYDLDSSKPFINYYMGQLYWRRGRLTEAEPFLRREYQKKPQWAELNLKLAQCSIERQDLTEGQKFLERYVSLNPIDQMASNNLLLFCINAGRFADAARNASSIEANGLVVPKEIRDRINAGLNGVTIK